MKSSKCEADAGMGSSAVPLGRPPEDLGPAGVGRTERVPAAAPTASVGARGGSQGLTVEALSLHGMALQGLVLHRAPGAGAGVGVPGSVSREGPVAQLAALVDFTGSMRLAAQLEQSAGSAAPSPGVTGLPDAVDRLVALRQMVRARLLVLRPIALAPLEGVNAPRPLTLDQIRQASAAAGLRPSQAVGGGEPGEVGVHGAAALRHFSAQLGQNLEAALRLCFRQSASLLGTLRWEIREELHALGPTVMRLEQMDGALREAMRTRRQALYERLVHALGGQLEQDCTDWALATEGLTGVAAAEEALLGPLLEPGGALGQHRRRCVRAARAIWEHESRALHGLLRGAEEGIEDGRMVDV